MGKRFLILTKYVILQRRMFLRSVSIVKFLSFFIVLILFISGKYVFLWLKLQNMKKFFFAVAIAFGISSAAMAQTKTVATTPAAKPAKEAASTKSTVAAPATTKTPAAPKATTAAAPAAATSTNGVKLKADGTPDKRYKAAAGPVKADGTPDKRFKSNKKN
jgi:uncharacterized membrane protein YcgQ (UPF0703/DUF1980 family)